MAPQRMIPEKVEGDFKEVFGRFHTMDTAEIVGTILELLRSISTSGKNDLVAVWGLLDFFASEVPREDVHRIKAIRSTILHRLEVLGEHHLKLNLELEHKYDR